MINIDDNIIKLTRGDSCVINITIYESDGETPYEPGVNDKIYLTIKPDINNDYYVLKKQFENESIFISKSDTIDLNFGTYFFDIRLENGDNYDTVLTEGSFILEGGTANAGN